MITSSEIKQVSSAIVKAQAKIGTVNKEGRNQFFKKPDGSPAPYVTLDSIIEALKKPLEENGLAVIQMPSSENDKPVVITRVQHESGEFMQLSTPLFLNKNDMQQFGSAITYSKRFALGSFFNIATEVDDDGNEASGNPKSENTPASKAIQNPQKTQDNKTKVYSFAAALGISDIKFKEHMIDYFGSPVDLNEFKEKECKEFCEYLNTKKGK